MGWSDILGKIEHGFKNLALQAESTFEPIIVKIKDQIANEELPATAAAFEEDMQKLRAIVKAEIADLKERAVALLHSHQKKTDKAAAKAAEPEIHKPEVHKHVETHAKHGKH